METSGGVNFKTPCLCGWGKRMEVSKKEREGVKCWGGGGHVWVRLGKVEK